MNSSVLASDFNPSVKIRLFSTQAVRSITLQGYGGLRVSGQRASGSVAITLQNDQVFVYDTVGHTWKDDHVTLASRAGRWIDIQPLNSPVRRTVGWLHVSVKNGSLQVVNMLPLETYVLGVVDGELGSVQFNAESLKAQLVASRSYVLATRGSRHREYDFCDGPHCQVYAGTRGIRPDFKWAMQSSRGEYLSYRGRPVPAFFHDSCGGKTASVQTVWNAPKIPYLQSVSDQDPEESIAYCRTAPSANWTFFASRRDLRECFSDKEWINGYDALDTLRVVALDDSERARFVLIQTAHPRWLPAAEVRRAVNKAFGQEVIRSTVFTITREGDGFRFIGHGWGHGVGLCQWGAIQMGRQGKKYRDILAHYYPGTRIEHLPEALWVKTQATDAVVQ